MNTSNNANNNATYSALRATAEGRPKLQSILDLAENARKVMGIDLDAWTELGDKLTEMLPKEMLQKTLCRLDDLDRTIKFSTNEQERARHNAKTSNGGKARDMMEQFYKTQNPSSPHCAMEICGYWTDKILKGIAKQTSLYEKYNTAEWSAFRCITLTEEDAYDMFPILKKNPTEMGQRKLKDKYHRVLEVYAGDRLLTEVKAVAAMYSTFTYDLEDKRVFAEPSMLCMELTNEANGKIDNITLEVFPLVMYSFIPQIEQLIYGEDESFVKVEDLGKVMEGIEIIPEFDEFAWSAFDFCAPSGTMFFRTAEERIRFYNMVWCEKNKSHKMCRSYGRVRRGVYPCYNMVLNYEGGTSDYCEDCFANVVKEADEACKRKQEQEKKNAIVEEQRKTAEAQLLDMLKEDKEIIVKVKAETPKERNKRLAAEAAKELKRQKKQKDDYLKACGQYKTPEQIKKEREARFKAECAQMSKRK